MDKHEGVIIISKWLDFNNTVDIVAIVFSLLLFFLFFFFSSQRQRTNIDLATGSKSETLCKTFAKNPSKPSLVTREEEEHTGFNMREKIGKIAWWNGGRRGEQRAILPCQVQYDVSLLKLVAWRRAWFKLNLQIFGYFIFGRERERENRQGRFVTYSLAGEFNSFRYKYISSGRSWEITFAGIMAKTRKRARK